jgi:hypothetical protein
MVPACRDEAVVHGLHSVRDRMRRLRHTTVIPFILLTFCRESVRMRPCALRQRRQSREKMMAAMRPWSEVLGLKFMV